ncbi:hypothetical protein Ms3S1_12260 [Methylosinus sp. 3S-1]
MGDEVATSERMSAQIGFHVNSHEAHWSGNEERGPREPWDIDPGNLQRRWAP